MDKKLALILQFGALDKLSGPLKNIIGLGKTGAPALAAMQREAKALDTELKQVNAQMQRGEGNIMDLAGRQMTLQRAFDKTTAEIEQQKRALGEYHARQKQVANFRAKMGGIADKAGMVGAGASVMLTAPILAFGAAAIQASRDASKAMAQTKASLASMGNTANRTFPQLQAQAEALMKTSLFDDDQILNSVTANLLTFGRVSGKVFDRAQQAVVDYSSKTGKDLQGATIMVGKALNDPVKGMTALGKAGIQFTADQKAMIQTMVKAGNVAGAQSMILAELEKQYGGSGKAARAADPTAAAAIDWGELQQAVGDKLLPQLVPLVGTFSRLLESFNKLSPGTQDFAIKLGIAAALFGPLMLGVSGLASGLGAIAPALTMVGRGFTAFRAAGGFMSVLAKAGPLVTGAFDAIKVGGMVMARGLTASILGIPIIGWIAAIATGAYLIWSNWGTLGPKFWALWDMIKNGAGTAIDWIKTNWQRLPLLVSEIGVAITMGLANGIKSGAAAVWEELKGVVLGGVNKVKAMLGIHSPSRVFMGIGGHVTDGLAMGVDRGAGRPVKSMSSLVTALTGAALMGSPAMASGGGAGSAMAARWAQAGSSPTFTITINTQPGQDAQAIAEEVMRLIDRAQRTARLSAYQDD